MLSIKGKLVFIPTYNGGCNECPFVYPKDCFFTGNSSKKLRLSESFIGVPITINDVTIRNYGKSTETLCILFSKFGLEYSIVVPWGMKEKSQETKLFEKLFCYYGTHRLEDVIVKCYEYEIIKRIEDTYIGQATKSKHIAIPQGIMFNRFVLVPNGGELWDSLQAEFGNDMWNMSITISTMTDDERYGLAHIERIFKENI